MYLAHYTKRFIPEFDAECRADAYEAALLLAEANLASAQAQLIQEQAQADVAAKEAKTMPELRRKRRGRRQSGGSWKLELGQNPM